MKGRWLLLGVALLAVLGLAALAAPVNAQSTGMQDVTVSVPAGQTVQIPVQLWCLNFGKPFPKAVTGPAGPAPANALAVVNAAYSGGQATSDPYQTQLALWYAVDGTYHDQAGQGHAVAQQIVSKAGVSAGAAATATVVSTAASSNPNLKVTVQNLTAVPDTNNSATPYHGTATLVIQNTGNSDANYTFTQGSTFTPATSAEQTLIGVATGTSAQATATTTTAAVATTTTVAPTVAATATTAATTAPTVAATATTAPTVAATSTPVTVETITPIAQATSTVTPGNLPTTGGSDGSMGLLLILGGLMVLMGGALAVRQNMARH